MQFLCDQCHTRYAIPDEKVRGKRLEIRCKSCGNVVEVKDSSGGSPSPKTDAQADDPKASKPASTAKPAATAKPTVTTKPTATPTKAGDKLAASAGLTPPSKLSAGLSKAGDKPAASAGLTPPSKLSAGLPKAGDKAPSSSALKPVSKLSAGLPKAGDKKAPSSTALKAIAKPLAENAEAEEKAQTEEKPKTEEKAETEKKAETKQKTETAKKDSESSVPSSSVKEEPPPDRESEAVPEAARTEQAAAQWFLGDARGEYGPMSFRELAARTQRGEAGPEAEAWREGMADWTALSDVPELLTYLNGAAPPDPASGPVPLAPSSKPPPRRRKAEGEGTTAADAANAAPGASAPSAAASPPNLRSAKVAWPTGTGTPVSRFALDEFSLPVSPLSESELMQGADPAALPLPVRTASELNILLVAERKRARRPMFFISGAAVLLAAVAVAVAVWSLSSTTRSQAPEGSATLAGNPGAAPPGMAPAPGADDGTRTAPQRPMEGDARDLGDLDIDVAVDTGGDPRKVSRRRRRSGNGADSPRSADTPAGGSSSFGSADPAALPSHRPRFTGIGSPGSPGGDLPGGGSATASGGAPGNLRSLVNRNQGALKRCYEKAALLDSRLRNPRLSVTVKVSSSGRVNSVRISPSRYEADTLGICVRRSIQSWPFPSFANDYSWTFSARFQGG